MTMRDQIAEILRGGRIQHIEEDVMADAILAALPDMIAPLVWERADLSAWGEFVWALNKQYTMHWEYGAGPNGEECFFSAKVDGVSCYSGWSEEAAKHAANTHHRAAIMAAFTGETQ